MRTQPPDAPPRQEVLAHNNNNIMSFDTSQRRIATTREENVKSHLRDHHGENGSGFDMAQKVPMLALRRMAKRIRSLHSQLYVLGSAIFAYSPNI